MEVVLLQMFLAIISFMVVTSTKVIGILALYGVMIYLLIRRENKKKTLL
ncbi:hypothetical protein [Peribacillus sp. TH27]|nr:hypothetical protein [Peribacillus sp. TH27]MBK5463558.1 hypothetical protein [Peribacillus sp. TH27]MBK5463571.1 hypothetical protein [Peribacillus sp. TH27]